MFTKEISADTVRIALRAPVYPLPACPTGIKVSEGPSGILFSVEVWNEVRAVVGSAANVAVKDEAVYLLNSHVCYPFSSE